MLLRIKSWLLSKWQLGLAFLAAIFGGMWLAHPKTLQKSPVTPKQDADEDLLRARIQAERDALRQTGQKLSQEEVQARLKKLGLIK